MNQHAPSFSLCQEDSTGNLIWRGSISSHGHCHDDVRLVYSENYPYEQIVVYIFREQLPRVNYHIHSDGSICYTDRWSPEWTALAVYLTVIRFLDEFYSGRMR
jgi:ubiquitin-protein ligase